MTASGQVVGSYHTPSSRSAFVAVLLPAATAEADAAAAEEVTDATLDATDAAEAILLATDEVADAACYDAAGKHSHVDTR